MDAALALALAKSGSGGGGGGAGTYTVEMTMTIVSSQPVFTATSSVEEFIEAARAGKQIFAHVESRLIYPTIAPAIQVTAAEDYPSAVATFVFVLAGQAKFAELSTKATQEGVVWDNVDTYTIPITPDQ